MGNPLLTFQLFFNFKALNEASAVLENSLKHRVKLNSEIESEKELFFRELKKMREHWRVRKTGNVVFGDLGYKICNFSSFRILLSSAPLPKFESGFFCL